MIKGTSSLYVGEGFILKICEEGRHIRSSAKGGGRDES
jgi:hypothetical protein